MMNKFFILFTILFIVGGCSTSQQLITTGSIIVGMTKDEICGATASTTTLYEDPCTNKSSDHKFYEDIGMEIWNNVGIWYVFENVTIPKTGATSSKVGNGRLIKIFYTKQSAVNFVNNFTKVVEEKKLTVEKAINKFFNNRKLEPFEGIWYNEKEIATIAVIKKGNIYERYTIDHKLSKKYESGQKYQYDLRAAAGNNIFVGKVEVYNTSNPDQIGVGSTTIILENINLYTQRIPEDCWTTYECWQEINNFSVRVWPNDFYEYNKKFGGSDEEIISNNKENVVSYGTGFLINTNGDIVTNDHVIDKCDEIYYYDTNNNEKKLSLISRDIKKDLAVIRSNSLKNNNLFFSFNDPKQTEEIIVYGYPFGDTISSQVKATRGIVSATVGFGNDSSTFQVDAAISPGNSGGPIVNKQGNLVGVVFATTDKKMFEEYFGTAPENMNFGIKLSTLKSFLESYNIEYLNSNEKNEVAQESIIQIYCSSN